MSDKQTKRAEEIAGKTFEPSEKNEDKQASPLEVTHDQVNEYYLGGNIDHQAGKDK